MNHPMKSENWTRFCESALDVAAKSGFEFVLRPKHEFSVRMLASMGGETPYEVSCKSIDLEPMIQFLGGAPVKASVFSGCVEEMHRQVIEAYTLISGLIAIRASYQELDPKRGMAVKATLKSDLVAVVEQNGVLYQVADYGTPRHITQSTLDNLVIKQGFSADDREVENLTELMTCLRDN